MTTKQKLTEKNKKKKKTKKKKNQEKADRHTERWSNRQTDKTLLQVNLRIFVGQSFIRCVRVAVMPRNEVQIYIVILSINRLVKRSNYNGKE